MAVGRQSGKGPWVMYALCYIVEDYSGHAYEKKNEKDGHSVEVQILIEVF